MKPQNACASGLSISSPSYRNAHGK
jgi:hypothetical protein